MNTILRFVNLELKGLFRTKKWIPLLIVLIIFSISIFQRIGYHKENHSVISDFLKSELNTYNAYSNYTDYSNMGFNVIVESSPSETFFSSPDKISEMSGRVNSIAALEIDSNSKGQSIFSGNSSLNIPFSQLVLYFGSLLVFLLGADSFRKKEYFRFLSSMCKPFKLFLYVVTARVVLLSLIFLVLFTWIIILTLLLGVGLGGPLAANLLKYGIMTLSTFLFYFAAGTFTGFLFSNQNRRDNKNPHSYTLTIWFLLLFVLPGITNLFNSTNKKTADSRYRLKADKLTIIDNFEKDAEKAVGKFNRNEMNSARKIIEIYYNEYYPRVEELEIDELNKVSEYYNKHNFLSMLIPTASYQLTCNELSSKGYMNYLSFHQHLIDMKRRFLRFWIDRVYYNDPKVMVNFIQNNENVFHAQSQIPAYFWLAVALNCFYSILLLSASSLLFKRWLYHQPAGELDKIKNDDINLGKRNVRFTWHVKSDAVKNYLYAMLSGRVPQSLMDRKMSLTLNNEKISEACDFLYICKKEHLPMSLKVNEFLALVCSLSKTNPHRLEEVHRERKLTELLDKPLGKLNERQSFHLQMALPVLVKKPYYLFDDIMSQLSTNDAIMFVATIDELEYVLFVNSKKSFEPSKNEDYDNSTITRWYPEVQVQKLTREIN